METILRREHDNEYVLRCMMWADNYWLFCDNKERLTCMVNDIIEELLDLDMEPKPESLWWTRAYNDEDGATLKVGNRSQTSLVEGCIHASGISESIQHVESTAIVRHSIKNVDPISGRASCCICEFDWVFFVSLCFFLLWLLNRVRVDRSLACSPC